MKNPKMKKIKSILERDEGRVNSVYQDTEGNLTFGIGHKIEPGDYIPDEMIDLFFRRDLSIFFTKADTYIYEHCLRLNEAREIAIVCLFFNLGSLNEFPNMTRFMKEKKWKAAAMELLYISGLNPNMGKSKYYRQVGKRAKRMAAIIETGKIEGYVF